MGSWVPLGPLCDTSFKGFQTESEGMQTLKNPLLLFPPLPLFSLNRNFCLSKLQSASDSERNI